MTSLLAPQLAEEHYSDQDGYEGFPLIRLKEYAPVDMVTLRQELPRKVEKLFMRYSALESGVRAYTLDGGFINVITNLYNQEAINHGPLTISIADYVERCAREFIAMIAEVTSPHAVIFFLTEDKYLLSSSCLRYYRGLKNGSFDAVQSRFQPSIISRLITMYSMHRFPQRPMMAAIAMVQLIRLDDSLIRDVVPHTLTTLSSSDTIKMH